MLTIRAPLAIPAASFIASVTLAQHVQGDAVLWAGALVACGIAFARSLGRAVFASGLGLLVVWSQPAIGPDPPGWIAVDRPVTMAGALVQGWRRDDFGWRSKIRLRSIRQGNRVANWTSSLDLTVSAQEAPVDGGQIRLTGFLRRPSGLRNDPPLPAGPWYVRVKSRRFLEIGTQTPIVRRQQHALRARLTRSLQRVEKRRTAGVMEALLLGRAEALSRTQRQTLRRFGLSHLFAVSGLHVGLVIAGSFLACGQRSRVLGAVAAVFVTALYVAIVGGRASVVRAALMAAVAAGAMAFRRPAEALQVLAVSLALMVGIWPEVVFDLGFQLTASATAGIVVLAPPFDRRWQVLPTLLRRPLAVSIAAQLGSAPLVWTRFALLTPFSSVFNLVAIPWLTALLACCFLWALVGLVSEPAATMLSGLVTVAVVPLTALEDFPRWPLLTWPLDAGFGKASAAAILLSIVFLTHRRRAVRLLLVMTAAGALIHPLPDRVAELIMIDVGQGDAFLVRDGRRAMLIDGGGWRHGDIAARALLPTLARRGLRRLDSIVVTHGDVDHCQGALDLLSYIPVEEVLIGSVEESGCGAGFATIAGDGFRQISSGDEWWMGRWRVRVLHPAGATGSGDNNDSVVLRVTGLGRTILLAGDVEASAESHIIRRVGASSLRSDILKVAHHGSGTSTTPAFLAAVDPRLALISAGRRNRYGHPAAGVVERLERSEIIILRTDRDGMVRLLFSHQGSTSIRRYANLDSTVLEQSVTIP